jgi:hypothetical protein
VSRLLSVALALAFLAAAAWADGASPVTVVLRETEPGRAVLRWRVPEKVAALGAPTPRLPDSCPPVGTRSVTRIPGALVLEQAHSCPDGLDGVELVLELPPLALPSATLLRVELLSGERHAVVLAPGRSSWRIPESPTDRAPPALVRASEAVHAGLALFVARPVHALFLLCLLLLGATAALRAAGAFTAGQLVGALLAASGVALGEVHGDLVLAAAAAVVAAEALRPGASRRGLLPVAAAAGLAHMLAHAGGSALTGALLALGFDAALVVGIGAGALVLRAGSALLHRGEREGPAPRIAAYALASAALALAWITPPTAASAPVPAPRALLPDLLPSGPSRPQAFLTVDAFEVRLEVLVRPGALAEELALPAGGVLAVEAQDAVLERARELVASRARVTIDGEPAVASDWRASFLTLDDRGALPRPEPVSEPLETALLGVTAVHTTPNTPREATLAWSGLGGAGHLPVTTADPEAVRQGSLAADTDDVRWVNELSEDPAPRVRATEVRPRTGWLPVGALAALTLGLAASLAAARRGRGTVSLALVRASLAGALLLAPAPRAAWRVPLPAREVPEPERAERILAGLLPNVYRALEFPTESAVYDRLALSVTGETLGDVYLQHRRAVVTEERGGARVRIQAVELAEVSNMEPAPGGDGFTADAAWTVGGTVTHFGHRHFRQNRYEARLVVVPVDGAWRIHALELTDERRVR